MGRDAVPENGEGGPWRRPLLRSVGQDVFDQKASTTPVVSAVAS